MSSAWHSVFGGGSGSGALGTGQYAAKSVDIDKNAYYDNDALNADKDQAQNQMLDVQNRSTPTASAAQLGQANMGTAAYGHANNGSAVTGVSQNATNTQLGPAQNATAADINRSDDQFRNQQQGLATQLTQAANGQGPSQAGIQLGQANAAATAQRMASAASDRGFGNTAASNRQLAYQQGAAQQANAIASAQTKIQEQQAAQASLGNVLNNARSQDIGVNTSQAGLDQQTSLANQDANNQFSLQQAQMNQQTALQNAAAGNQFGLANMSALNTQGLANQSANNQQIQANQNASNQFSLANASADNQFALQQAANQQQTNLANQQSQLQTMGLNDAQIRSLLGTSVGIDAQTQQNEQAYNALNVQNNYQQQQLDSQAYNNAATNRSGLVSGIAGAALGAFALSDEKQKTDVSSVDKNDINQFLSTAPNTMDSVHTVKPINSPNSNPKYQQLQNMANSLNTGKGNYGNLGSTLVNSYIKGKMASDAAQNAATNTARKAFLSDVAMSDEKQKKNISNASNPEVDDFLDNMGGHKYEYKNPNMAGADDRTHYSPMAQELEKSKIGKSMVYTDPNTNTKYVDYARGYGALMAATAELNKRLNKIEGKK